MFDFNFTSSLRGSQAGLCQAIPGAMHLKRNADYWVLLFVRKECLYIEIDGIEYTVEKDQTLLLPAGITHQGTRPYDEGLHFYWLHFYVDDTDIGLPYTIPQQATLVRPQIMVEYMRRYLDDQQNRRFRQVPQRAHLILALILLEIAGNSLEQWGLPDNTVALAEKLNAYVCNRFDQDITVSSLAEEFGYTPDHLSRVFKKAMKVSLTDAIHRNRMDKAAQLLLESNLKVDEIAYKVGYNDRTYFHKMFKRHWQTTPSAYRQLHAKMNVNGRDDN